MASNQNVFTRFNEWLVTNYPIIWRTGLHKFLLFLVIGNTLFFSALFLSTLSGFDFYSVRAANTSVLSILGIGLLVYGLWIFRQVQQPMRQLKIKQYGLIALIYFLMPILFLANVSGIYFGVLSKMNNTILEKDFEADYEFHKAHNFWYATKDALLFEKDEAIKKRIETDFVKYGFDAPLHVGYVGEMGDFIKVFAEATYSSSTSVDVEYYPTTENNHEAFSAPLSSIVKIDPTIKTEIVDIEKLNEFGAEVDTLKQQMYRPTLLISYFEGDYLKANKRHLSINGEPVSWVVSGDLHLLKGFDGSSNVLLFKEKLEALNSTSIALVSENSFYKKLKSAIPIIGFCFFGLSLFWILFLIPKSVYRRKKIFQNLSFNLADINLWYPPFIKKLDSYLSVNHPIIWSSKILIYLFELVFYFSILYSVGELTALLLRAMTDSSIQLIPLNYVLVLAIPFFIRWIQIHLSSQLNTLRLADQTQFITASFTALVLVLSIFAWVFYRPSFLFYILGAYMILWALVIGMYLTKHLSREIIFGAILSISIALGVVLRTENLSMLMVYFFPYLYIFLYLANVYSQPSKSNALMSAILMLIYPIWFMNVIFMVFGDRTSFLSAPFIIGFMIIGLPLFTAMSRALIGKIMGWSVMPKMVR